MAGGGRRVEGDLTPLGPGEEFRRIRKFLGSWEPMKGVRVGPGDDAAILSDGTVLSSDMAIEGVHFRLDWIDPFEAGGRAARAALSDLAAVAASPVGLLVSLGVPERGGSTSETLTTELMRGVKEVAADTGAGVLGGDLVRSPGPIVIDVMVVGRCDQPLLRSGAGTGDGLWVTGRLGASAAAVAAWQRGETPPSAFRAAFARPPVRFAEARYLVGELGATAGLDLSDGLAGDAGHLAAASGLRAILDGPDVPMAEGITALDMVLHGGEDFELLVALPPALPAREVEKFRRRFDLSLTRVGTLDEGDGVWLREETGGTPERLARGGWDHFDPDTGGEAT